LRYNAFLASCSGKEEAARKNSARRKNMLKRIALFLLVVWLPSGCAAAREEKSAAGRAAQAAFCWPLQTFRYSRSQGGGWLASRGRGSQHLGVDMFASVGTPVRAIADGVVHDISTGGWGRGNVAIMVKHRLADGRWFIALYGHIRNAKGLRKGSRVQACSSIGVVGPYSCGSHLHFGVINPGRLPHAPYGTSKRGDHNNFIDPLQFLRSGQPGGTAEAQPPPASAPVAFAKADSPAEAEAVPLNSATLRSAKEEQSRKQVRSIRSKNKKRSVAASEKQRPKKAAAKKAVAPKSSRSAAGKVRSLTGSSKRAVSARGRR
jgi:hypothetical protein